MALSDRAMIIVAAAACVAIGVAYLPPGGRVTRTQSIATPALARLHAAAAAVRRTVAAHEIEGRRDSVVAWARRQPGDSLLVLGGGADSALARRLVGQEWAEAGVAHPVIRPVVVYVTDSARMVGRLRVEPVTSVVLLPDATGASLCVALLPAPRAGRDRWSRFEIRSGLGPCAFEAAYGRPGPAVERWLGSRGYDLAGTTMLSAAAGHISPAGDDARRPGALLRLIGMQNDGDALSLAGWACVRGNAARCADAVLGARPGAAQPAFPGAVSTWRGFPARDFGGAEASYLADVAREIGPERFARFWHARGDVESAFRVATGRPIGEWTRDWAARRVRPAMAGVTAGVPVNGRGASLAVLLGLGMAALGAVVATRRQVR